MKKHIHIQIDICFLLTIRIIMIKIIKLNKIPKENKKKTKLQQHKGGQTGPVTEAENTTREVIEVKESLSPSWGMGGEVEVVVDMIVEMEVEMVEEVVLLVVMRRFEAEDVQEEVLVSSSMQEFFDKRLALIPAGAAVVLGGELNGCAGDNDGEGGGDG